MANPSTSESKEKVSRATVTRWKDIVALFAGLASLIGVAIGLWTQVKPSKPAAELQILSANRLTPTIDLPDLTSNFMYAGAPVRDLWKLKMRFINTGSVSIIGQGAKKNILGEYLTVQFNTSLKVFGRNVYDVEKGSYIQPEGESFPGATLVGEGGNRIYLKFQQWRPNEEVIYSLYVVSDTIEYQPPLPKVTERDIVDGDLKVRDFTTLALKQKMSLLDRLPKFLAILGRILGYLLILGVFVTLVIFLSLMWVRKLQWLIWKTTNKVSINEYLANPEYKKTPVEKDKIWKKPWSSNYWDSYTGPKPPKDDLVLDGWFDLFFASFIVLLIICSLLALAAAAIYI